MHRPRTYVVADMHGRYDLFLKARELIEADAGPQGGTFIVLGDFVDRGLNPRAIIEDLMAGPNNPMWRWIVLQGNHEDIMLQALADARHLRWWIGNGGGSTLKSYGYVNGDPIAPLKVPQTHIDWLTSLPVTFKDEHRIYVHAGIPFDRAISETPKETKQWMLYPSGDDYYPDAEYYDDKPHVSGKHIVHGHHQSATHPLLKSHRTNLDSYAWATGRLAIGVFDDSYPGPIKIIDAISYPG